MVGVEPSNCGITLVFVRIRTADPAAGNEPVEICLIESSPVGGDGSSHIVDEVDKVIIKDACGAVVGVVTGEIPRRKGIAEINYIVCGGIEVDTSVLAAGLYHPRHDSSLPRIPAA